MPLNNTAALTIFTSDWKLRDQNLNPFTYCDSKRRKRSRRKLARFIVEVKKKKKRVKILRHSAETMFFETQGGRKKAGNVHKDVFHGWSGAIPSDWLALRVEDVKARRALRQQKPHRAVENGFITTSRSRATASAVDWTSRDLIRGTAGLANVNKPTSNTTRRDAARKRSSVIVGGSGMMWLSTLCMIVFNVGWFSAPDPDDETHLLMNPRSQSQDSVNFGINAIPCKYTDISADKQKKQKCNKITI